MTDKIRSICLIPARGGSKRIPKKNIKSFLGKPIIAWPIEAALSSQLFDKIIVSTDDEKIADIAKSFGAEVPFMRSADVANDEATITDVIKDTLDRCAHDDQDYDYMFMAYATAPNLKIDDIKAGFTLLVENDFDTVFPVLRYHFPIQRAFSLSENGNIEYREPDFTFTRSQDLPDYFHDAGQWIWIDIKKFNANGRRLIAGNSGALELDPRFFHDIDDETDWKIAEQKVKMQNLLNEE